MSTSSFEPHSEARLVQLTVEAGRPDDELTLVGPDLEHVAEGVGRIDATVERGLYEIVARAGPTIERRRIRLGATMSETISLGALPFPTAVLAPALPSTTRPQVELVERVTTGLAPGAADAALVLVVRGRDGPRAAATFALIDRAATLRESLAGGWTEATDGSARARATSLPPGGYGLRFGPGEGAIDQAIWLASGMQTIVFVAGPDQRSLRRSCSVHMMPVGASWTRYDAFATSLELALWGLREGRWQPAEPLVRDASRVDLIARQSPVLGLALAHLVLSRPKPDPHVLEQLLTALEHILPSSPDVDGLRLLAAERGIGRPEPASVSHGWPPMFLASYQALVRRDATKPVTLIDGSPGERVAANLVPEGIWTAWRPIAPRDHVPWRLARSTAEPDRIIAKVAEKPDRLRRVKSKDPATRRVAAYLAAVAELEGEGGRGKRVGAVTTADIALATGLPSATVVRSLRRIRLAIGGIAILPFIVTLNVFAVLALVILANLSLLSSGGPLPTFVVPTLPPVTTVPATSTPTVAPATPSPVLPALPFIEPLAPVDMGPVGMKQTGETPVTLSNTGEGPLTVTAINVGGQQEGEFRTAGELCTGQQIAPGASCVITVAFSPFDYGSRLGRLTVESSELAPAVVELMGTGVGDLLLRPGDLDFGEVPSELDEIVTATGPVLIETVQLEDDDLGVFDITSDECTGRTVSQQDSCLVTVEYLGHRTTPSSAILRFHTEDQRDWLVGVTGSPPQIR